MKLSPSLGYVVVVGLFLVSCQVAPILHLVNASGRDVQVSVMGKEMRLPSDQEIQFEYPYSANGGMSIRHGECVLWYLPPDPPPPPNDFMWYRIFRPQLNVRLEQDWTIVVLAPLKEAASASPFSEQPPGFPLPPEHDGGCG